MTHHIWGDEDFDWDALNDAMDYIRKYVYTRSFGYISMKEKYGTIRYERVFIPSIMLLEMSRNRLASWLVNWKPFIYLYTLWREYAYWLTKRAAIAASKKFPQVAEEILDEVNDDFFR